MVYFDTWKETSDLAQLLMEPILIQASLGVILFGLESSGGINSDVLAVVYGTDVYCW